MPLKYVKFVLILHHFAKYVNFLPPCVENNSFLRNFVSYGTNLAEPYKPEISIQLGI